MNLNESYYDPEFITKFNDLDENQITIDEFIDFLIDMKKKGVDKDAKLYICGLNKFFFHYNSKKKLICLDTESLLEQYKKGTSLSLRKYTRVLGKQECTKIDYDEEEWKMATLFGLKCEFSDMRINKYSIPKGKYLYEVEKEEFGNKPIKIAEHITTNFFGTIAIDYPLELDDKVNYSWLEDRDLKIEWVNKID